MEFSPKLIAYYLPQYHPTPENDKWWGKGFTEWTNVTQAKPLFKGHYQPRIPADLGYYDLRIPEVREQQASLAHEYGIHGFCYYHYWFNGRRLLERPFEDVVNNGSPDFPFMLCWANQTWKGVWFGNDNPETLMEQTYGGRQDYINHFNALRKAFADDRYITIEGKPVFHVYMPLDIPNQAEFTDTFRECAHRAGFRGIYLLAGMSYTGWNPVEHGFDGMVDLNSFRGLRYNTSQYIFQRPILKKVEGKLKTIFGYGSDITKRKKPFLIDYVKAMRHLISSDTPPYDFFPCTVHDWDNSARSGNKSLIFQNSTPETWRKHLTQAINRVRHNTPDKQIVMLKSWNEWAEGNYLEPDTRWGNAYLQVIKDVLSKNNNI